MKLRYPYESKFSLEFGNISTIKLLLSVESSTGLIPFTFLLDTGADVSSLPASAASKLGIDLSKCPKIPMSGFEGSTISVYKSKIKIRLNKQSFSTNKQSFSTNKQSFSTNEKSISVPCVFNPNDDVPILLGRAGIIDRFNIFMDGKKKEITFEEL